MPGWLKILNPSRKHTFFPPEWKSPYKMRLDQTERTNTLGLLIFFSKIFTPQATLTICPPNSLVVWHSSVIFNGARNLQVFSTEKKNWNKKWRCYRRKALMRRKNHADKDIRVQMRSMKCLRILALEMQRAQSKWRKFMSQREMISHLVNFHPGEGFRKSGIATFWRHTPKWCENIHQNGQKLMHRNWILYNGLMYWDFLCEFLQTPDWPFFVLILWEFPTRVFQSHKHRFLAKNGEIYCFCIPKC